MRTPPPPPARRPHPPRVAAALLVLLCGCGDEVPVPAPAGALRLGGLLAAREDEAPPPRTLFALDRGTLEAHWIVRPVPGAVFPETEPPRWSADGALRLGTDDPDRPVRLLCVRLGVDPGAVLRVRARARAGTGAVPWRALELTKRPRAPHDLIIAVTRGHHEAAHELGAGTTRAGDELVLDATITLGRRTTTLALVAGEADGACALAELRVEDTGRRAGAPSETPRRLVVDGEARPGFRLAGRARLEFALPRTARTRRLRVGVAARRGRGCAALEVACCRGDREVDARTLAIEAPRTVADETWRDPAPLTIPPGPAGTLVVRLEPASGRPVVALAEPVLLPAARADGGRPNLLLVSIDTLRADALGLFGGHPDASPTLDALAPRGVAFDTCVAPSPYTLPSHVTMLSGQQPTVHGVLRPPHAIAPGRTPLLAEACARAGMVTAAFTGGGYLDHRYGFAAGFDAYATRDDLHHERDEPLAWLRAHADVPFFLFLHTFIVHEAVHLPEPYASRFDPDCRSPGLHGHSGRHEALGRGTELRPGERAHLERFYAGAVRRADDAVARVLDVLAEEGVLDETLVVVTSDHGQEIGERGAYAHGHSLYEEVVRIPLILAGPDVPARGVVDAVVGLVDVAPTLADLLALGPLPGGQGRSLAGLLAGRRWPDRPLLSEGGIVDARALRWGDEKLVVRGEAAAGGDRTELYDLAADPGETHDLDDEPARVAEARRRLRDHQASLRRLAETLDARHAVAERELAADEIARLRELGYLDG